MTLPDQSDWRRRWWALPWLGVCLLDVLVAYPLAAATSGATTYVIAAANGFVAGVIAARVSIDWRQR